MKKVALFPGSFDPFTKGHHDLVIRGLQLFDEIIIAVGYNTSKQRYFSMENTVASITTLFSSNRSVQVISYNSLTVDLAKKHNIHYLLRGLRNTIDFEFEKAIARMNQKLYSEMETVFLLTSSEYESISSTIVREIHKSGGDISQFIP